MWRPGSYLSVMALWFKLFPAVLALGSVAVLIFTSAPSALYA